jgi:hypothetical protein
MEITIENLTRKQCVEFAIHCAEDVFLLNDDKTREIAQKCIDYSKKVLEGTDSVTEEELESIAKICNRIDVYNTSSYHALKTAKNAIYTAMHYCSKSWLDHHVSMTAKITSFFAISAKNAAYKKYLNNLTN